MEAASVPRGRRRRRSPTWKAPVALVLYAGAVFVAWTLVSGAIPAAPEEEAPPASPAPARTGAEPGAELALTTLATRASRSVVTVGESAGFVAWTANGLSLVVTFRPAGGWQTGDDRAVTVSAGGETVDGKLVRADAQTGLGLVRVEGELARPLWQAETTPLVRAGDRLAIVSPGSPTLFVVSDARPGAIWGAPPGARPGLPVVDQQGVLVGVASGGRVVPIARACGAIRRC